jgi:hypothetical protein
MNMIASSAAFAAAMPDPGVLPDPIFRAIEDHKSARAVFCAAVDRHCDLECELPRDKRRTTLNTWEERFENTDDPRWIESEREVHLTGDAETDAACNLVSIKATTLAGLAALLQYAIEADIDGEGWPRDLQSDDGKRTRSWHYFLVENLAGTFSEMMPLA